MLLLQPSGGQTHLPLLVASGVASGPCVPAGRDYNFKKKIKFVILKAQYQGLLIYIENLNINYGQWCLSFDVLIFVEIFTM